MIVNISGTEYPYQHNSINIDDTLNSRSTAGFNIVDKVGNWRFKKGEQVHILEGNKENCVPNFNYWSIIDPKAQIISDYELKLVTTEPRQDSLTKIPIKASTQYYFKHESTTYMALKAINVWGEIIATIYLGRADQPGIVNTPAGTVELEVSTYNLEAGTFYYRNMMLTEGPTPQPFEPRVVLFAGLIDKPVSNFVSLAHQAKLHVVDCVDWHFFPGKRIVARSYENKNVRYILNDLMITYLNAEGIKEGMFIEDGPTLAECVFNYIYADEALDALAEAAGADWYIDQYKELYFFERSQRFAPITITETSPIKNIRVEPYAEDYRNKQYIKAGTDLTDPLVERFKGTGQNQTFVVSFPIGKVPTVKVNGVVKTMGIRGLDENTEFYWNKGDKVVSQKNEATAPSVTDTVEITYQGMMDIIIVSGDQDAIDERKAIEGGTGIHDNTLDAPQLTSRDAAFETAAVKLARYSKIGNQLSFTTHIRGLRAGMLLKINLPSFGINNVDYLIQQVRSSQMGLGDDDDRMWYDVQLVDGAATGGWVDFFKKLANKNNTFVIRENAQESEVLLLPLQYSKTWTQSMNPNIYRDLFPASNLYPGATVYPSFEPVDRVKYMVVKSFGAEILRKPILKQYYENDNVNVLMSVSTILPFECVGKHITAIEWYGGDNATDDDGTGVLIDSVAYVHDKTALEMIQVTRKDTKGW